MTAPLEPMNPILMPPPASEIPDGTKRVVIFDTNAYRQFAGGKPVKDARSSARELRMCEQAAGVFALANPFVMWELAAHLADPEDGSYKYCLSALTFLAEHTWSRQDPPGGICHCEDPELIVCRTLFNLVPPGPKSLVQSLNLLAAHLKANAPDLSDPACQIVCKELSARMEALETKWLQDLEVTLGECEPETARLWIGGSDNSDIRAKLKEFFHGDKFMHAWAGDMVARCANHLNAQLLSDEIEKHIQTVCNVFPAPFQVMSKLLQDSLSLGPAGIARPPKKWANYIWDSAICFSIGRQCEKDGNKVCLVVADHAIIDAARTASSPDKIMSLEDYLESVGWT